MTRSQPSWQPPEGSDKTRLKLYNSLTRQKEIFVPQFGNKVLWYSCGPTVYDAAHMGHARSYISFDILRRVLADYFSYDVFYVMNITDIDDKIIKRARQNYLFDQYAKTSNDVTKVIADVYEAVKCFKALLASTDDNDKRTMLLKMIESTENALKNAENTQLTENVHQEALKHLLSSSRDILSDWLDEKEGKNVCDNSIFSSLPAKWEEAFYEDMDALNVW
ncbi:cysteine--tRNA ligase, cytoplasmic-like, partial [Stegodyphus dumicola]|uniref:cysteine--tRNA ligase, cytoplasmic-like n=1 Tax=Stegodyphus dumicola TaxID=202533 RepID=UPI0015ADA992